LRVNRFAHRASSCFQRALARSAAGDTKPRSSQRQRLACCAGPRGAPQNRLAGGLRRWSGTRTTAVWQRAATTPDPAVSAYQDAIDREKRASQVYAAGSCHSS
jgi:hypothetical protein